MTTDAASRNAQDLKMLWQEHIRRALGQPYLLMLMVGSLMLSVASFFTTFMGMLHFMPVILVTFCIVFAIQALLFVTSWRIGFALADREDTPLFTLLVFLICLATSVFFSWVALFESINDEETQARTRQVRMQAAVEETIGELKTRSADYQRAQMEALIKSPAFVSWTENVDRVAQEAMSARGALEAARDRAATSTAERIQALETERARILREDAADAERVSSSERRLERLEAQRQEISERVATLRAEVAEADRKVVVQEGLMEAEETGGGDGRVAGRGPFWRQLRDQRNILAAERDAKRRLFDSAREEFEEVEKRIETIRAEVAGATASQGSSELAILERRIAELKSGVESGDLGPATALETEVERMRSDIGAFTSQFELAAFDEAAARCSSLLETMRAEPALASRVEGLTCDRAALAVFINPARDATESQRALAANCSPDGAAARSLSKLGFEEAVEYGRGCIDRSGLPTERVADLRGEISRLVDEEDPNASQFVKTVNGFRAGDKLNFLALGIALFIDILVLFSGLIGALSASDSIARHFGRHFTRTQADNFVRALEFRIQSDETLPVARALMKHMKPYIAEPRGFWGRKDDSLIAKIDVSEAAYDEERSVMLQFLLEQYAQGHAIIDEETSDKERGRYVFLLRKPVIDAVRDLYLRRAEDEVRLRTYSQIAQEKKAIRDQRREARMERARIRYEERKQRLEKSGKARVEKRDGLKDAAREKAQARAKAAAAERAVASRQPVESARAAEPAERARDAALALRETARREEARLEKRREERLEAREAAVRRAAEGEAIREETLGDKAIASAASEREAARPALSLFRRKPREQAGRQAEVDVSEPGLTARHAAYQEADPIDDDGAFELDPPERTGRRLGLGRLVSGVAGAAGGLAARTQDVIDRVRFGREIEIGDDDYDGYDDYADERFDDEVYGAEAEDEVYAGADQADAAYEDDTLELSDAPSREELAADKGYDLDQQKQAYFGNINRPAQSRRRREDRDEWSA